MYVCMNDSNTPVQFFYLPSAVLTLETIVNRFTLSLPCVFTRGFLNSFYFFYIISLTQSLL